MSPKFAKVSFLYGDRRVMIHGVCYLSRSVHKCVILDKVTCKEDVLRSKGTVNTAVVMWENQYADSDPLSFKMIRSSYTLCPMPVRN